MGVQYFYKNKKDILSGPYPLSKFLEWVDAELLDLNTLIKLPEDDKFLVLKDVIKKYRPQLLEEDEEAPVQQQPPVKETPKKPTVADLEDKAIVKQVLGQVIDTEVDEVKPALLPVTPKQQQPPQQVQPQQPWFAQNAPNTGYMPQQAFGRFDSAQQQQDPMHSVLRGSPMAFQAPPMMHHPAAHFHPHHHPFAAFTGVPPYALNAAQLEDQLLAQATMVAPQQQLQQQGWTKPVTPTTITPQQVAPKQQQQQAAAAAFWGTNEDDENVDEDNEDEDFEEEQIIEPVKIVETKKSPAASQQRIVQPIQPQQQQAPSKQLQEPKKVKPHVQHVVHTPVQQPAPKPQQPVIVSADLDEPDEDAQYLASSNNKNTLFSQFLPSQVQQQAIAQQQQQQASKNPWQTPVVTKVQHQQAVNLETIQKKQAVDSKKAKKEQRKVQDEVQTQRATPWGATSQVPSVPSFAAIQEQTKKDEKKEAKQKIATNPMQQAAVKSAPVGAWVLTAGSKPVKTLEEIQREERAAAKKSAQQPAPTAAELLIRPVQNVTVKKPAQPEPAKEVKATKQPIQPQQQQPQPIKKQPQIVAHESDDEEEEMFWDQDASNQVDDEDKPRGAFSNKPDFPSLPTTSKPAPAQQQAPAKQQQQDKKKNANKKDANKAGSYATALNIANKAPLNASVFDSADFPVLKAEPTAPKKSVIPTTRSNETVALGQVNMISADFKEWYKRSLGSLGKKYDSSLMTFLLSLQSELEIEEYLKEYVGTTGQARQFIDDFKKFRSFELNVVKQKKQQQKKTSKKKGEKLDPSVLGFHSERKPGMLTQDDQ